MFRPRDFHTALVLLRGAKNTNREKKEKRYALLENDDFDLTLGTIGMVLSSSFIIDEASSCFFFASSGFVVRRGAF